MPGFDGKVKDGVLDWKAPKGEWRLIAAFCGKTLQKVKRAAPGGEGYVMDHFSARAVRNYLGRFERAFPVMLQGLPGLPLLLIRIISSMIPMKSIKPTGLLGFLTSSLPVAVISWKNIYRNSLLRANGRRLPDASFPIIVKRLLNFSRRILPASGPNGRIGTVPKPVIRHMALPEI